MSIIIKNELIRKIIKYFVLFVAIILGLYIFTIIIQAVFNLGKYIGTFLRCLYALIRQLC